MCPLYTKIICNTSNDQEYLQTGQYFFDTHLKAEKTAYIEMLEFDRKPFAAKLGTVYASIEIFPHQNHSHNFA
jgi:hypothetical protein